MKRPKDLIGYAREASERCLTRMGETWRRDAAIYAVITLQTDQETSARVVRRDALLGTLRSAVARGECDAQTAEDIIKRIERRPSEIPHVIQWEHGTDLEFIEPRGTKPTGRGGDA